VISRGVCQSLFAAAAAVLLDEAGITFRGVGFFSYRFADSITTLSNAHPPLPSIYLALWWKTSGFSPEVTREAGADRASLGLLAVWRLALRLTGSATVASGPWC